MVLIESARRNWSAIERNAWLADADADPAAVLEVLHDWRGGPRGGRVRVATNVGSGNPLAPHVDIAQRNLNRNG